VSTLLCKFALQVEYLGKFRAPDISTMRTITHQMKGITIYLTLSQAKFLDALDVAEIILGALFFLGLFFQRRRR
jgi:hypothetical protein